MEEGTQSQEHKDFKDPKQNKQSNKKWSVLAATCLLNFAINAKLISLESVRFKAAVFYRVEPQTIDLISGIPLLAGLPMSFVASYLTCKVGIRITVVAAGFLTFLSSVLRGLSSSFPGLGFAFLFSRQIQFWMVLAGQGLLAIAWPLAACLPAKVSQDWFAEEETLVATGLMVSSSFLGLATGLTLTPLTVSMPGDLQHHNLIWSLSAVLPFFLALFTMNNSYPQIPPTASALKQRATKMTFNAQLKGTIQNRNFLGLFFLLSCVTSIVYTFLANVDHLLCGFVTHGWFANLLGGIFLIGGFMGSIISPWIALLTNKIEKSLKCLMLTTYIAVLLTCSTLWVSSQWWMVGFTLFIIIPLGLELFAENVYPSDPSVGASMLHGFSSFLTSCLTISSRMAFNENERATCQNLWSTGCFLGTILTLVVMVFTGLRSETKRTEANTDKQNKCFEEIPLRESNPS